jgi:hypothetical protein
LVHFLVQILKKLLDVKSKVGSDLAKKFLIRPDPDPQHCTKMKKVKLDIGVQMSLVYQFCGSRCGFTWVIGYGYDENNQ